MEKAKLRSIGGLAAQAAVLTLCGTAVLFKPSVLNFSVYWLLLGLLVFAAASGFFAWRQERNRRRLYEALGTLAGVIACLCVPALPRAGISVLFGCWALLLGAIDLLYFGQLLALREKRFWRPLAAGLISLGFGLAVIFHPLAKGRAISVIIGAYLLLYGVWTLVDALFLLAGRNVEASRTLSGLHVRMPVALAALLPSLAVDRINRELLTHQGDIVTRKGPAPEQALEVLFHLGHHVAMGFGHVDVCFRGRVYSYGCYDDASNRLGGLLSDGVFMLAEKESYLRYCQTVERKNLVGYEIALTGEQAARVRDALERIERRCEPWTPTDQNTDRPGASRHAMAAIGCRYLKEKKGPFAIYNTFKTNCVAMAELLAAESGLTLLPARSIVTPGSYFAFLGRELKDAASPVCSRTVYHNPQ